MKIVKDTNSVVIDYSEVIERVDAQGESNLIKVNKGNGFYYIGSVDRDQYEIIDVPSVPDDFVSGKYKYTTDFELNPDYVEPTRV